jgi:hypothetical protein
MSSLGTSIKLLEFEISLLVQNFKCQISKKLSELIQKNNERGVI